MTAFRAVIIPAGSAGFPDGDGDGYPDNSLPGSQPGIDNSLPGGRPPHISTGPVVPPSGNFPAFPAHPWLPGLGGRPLPTPPIFIPPDGVAPGLPSLPIVLPPSVWPPIPWPPVPVKPVRPANPIVLPPLPEGRMTLALVVPLPESDTGVDNTLPGGPPATGGTLPTQPEVTPQGVPAGAKRAVVWFGPGTAPVLAYIAPPATPK
jgi:hypothetical protein